MTDTFSTRASTSESPAPPSCRSRTPALPGAGSWRRTAPRSCPAPRSLLVLVATLASLEAARAEGDPLRPGDALLVEEQEIASERVEVSFVSPPGSVVTGIGARAHLDNITTLRVTFRPLRRDGTLGPASEARRGSEPDHACEALIRLPDPYVACGFGARGAPEWDVTTLWVVARPLRADGLGPEKIFRDGFEPEHGLERRVVADRDGAILTGVGLRFSLNDVAGIAARSARVVRFEGDPVPVRGAYFTRPGAVTAEAARTFLDHFPGAEIWVPAPALADIAPRLPEGAVLGVERRQGGVIVDGRACRLLPSDVGPPPIATRNPALPEAREDARGGGTLVSIGLGEELDPAGRLPSFCAPKVAARVIASRRAGLPVIFELVSGRSLAVPDRPGTASLAVARSLAGDTPRPPRSVAGHWASERYGPAASICTRALRRAGAFLRRTLALPGGPLWTDGRYPFGPRDGGSWLGAGVTLDGGARRDALDALRFALHEVDGVVEELGEAAASLEDEALRRRVAALRARYEALADLGARTRAAADAHLAAALYRLDGAPATNEAFEAALDRLLALGSGERDWGDAGPLAARLRDLRDRGTRSSPVLQGFRAVEAAAAAGRDAEAARAMRELLEDPKRARHLAKHSERLAAALSSLGALWSGSPPEDIRLLWGGDGRFDVVRRAGRWGLRTTERGPVIYADRIAPERTTAATRVVTFEYLDVPGSRLVVHYDSDFPGGLEEREYRPVEATATEGTGSWRRCEVELPKALFQGRQNHGADFRLLSDPSGAVFRDIRVRDGIEE